MIDQIRQWVIDNTVIDTTRGSAVAYVDRDRLLQFVEELYAKVSETERPEG